MPTPSSRALLSHAARSNPYSCPDPNPDEDEDQERFPSPSTWLPLAPGAYADAASRPTGDTARMDEDIDTARSVTLSPRPESGSSQERELGPEGERDIPIPDLTDDDCKRATLDDVDMVPVPTSSRAPAASSRDGASISSVAPSEAAEQGRGTEPRIGQRLLTEDDLDLWDPINGSQWQQDSGLAGLGPEYAQQRRIPIISSQFLRPGSRFTGTQTSERQRYDVQVEIKSVDLRESTMCGYLRIEGLTNDHPSLTTYFEGEIIGPKYGFITTNPSWGATEKIDLSHWQKFNAFRPHTKLVRKGGRALLKDAGWSENLFMRWKEHFLVPDHQVRTINGASFEGFYYICFNQLKGEVDGIYFHSNSAKFQQLELKHVNDKGRFGAVEFR